MRGPRRDSHDPDLSRNTIPRCCSIECVTTNPLGAAAMRGGAPQPGVSLVLWIGSRRRSARSLIIACKKLVGQRVTLENQIRWLAVVFGVRLPRALSPAFIRQALQASDGIAGL